MLVIVCPHCGPRNSDEYSFQGEIIPRPNVAGDVGEWRRYLYMRRNSSGWQRERWFHVSGCRRFLNIERNNLSNEIRSVTDVAGDAS
jgi:heterotetrameric sarcosine oxidase delta subunit